MLKTSSVLRRWVVRVAAVFLVVLLFAGRSSAYSVLTHEEVIDLVWTDDLRPLLLQRFPGLTEEQITEAHAYAYGGAVIQDLGYYPFGSVEFSNLVHYVRSGDFVRELLLESRRTLTSTPLPWARWRIMPRTSPAIRQSTNLFRLNIPSCGRSTVIPSGTPKTTPRI
jgi:hypothetical protein